MTDGRVLVVVAPAAVGGQRTAGVEAAVGGAVRVVRGLHMRTRHPCDFWRCRVGVKPRIPHSARVSHHVSAAMGLEMS